MNMLQVDLVKKYHRSLTAYQQITSLVKVFIPERPNPPISGGIYEVRKYKIRIGKTNLHITHEELLNQLFHRQDQGII